MFPKETRNERQFPEVDIFRRHVLYQTSWPPSQCQHDMKHINCPSSLNRFQQYDVWRKKYSPQSRKCASRRSTNTTTSSKGTTDGEERGSKEKDYMKEPGKWTPSRFLYTAKYGNLYELNRNSCDGDSKKTPTKNSVWLWESEYSDWLEKSGAQTDQKQQSKSIRSTPVSRRRSSTKKKQSYLPHADTYAKYFDAKITKQKRKQAVTIMQKFARGWFVRANIKRLSRKSNSQLQQCWPHLMQEYKDLLRRVKHRYNRPVTSFSLNFKHIDDYIERKQTYHKVFDEVSAGNRQLTFEQLKTFFWKCQLYPTTGEIRRAVQKVKDSCQNRTDLIILFENCNEISELCFYRSKTFCELLVSSISGDRFQNRIGFATFTESVKFHCPLEDRLQKVDILEKIGRVNPVTGPPRLQEALVAVHNTMTSHSRPWCRQVCVLLTSGRALHYKSVQQESVNLTQNDIELYLVGVGEDVLTEETRLLVKNTKYDFRLSTYDCVAELVDVLLSMLVNKPDTADDSSRVNMFSKVNTMEILWTIYPPKGCGRMEMKKSRWIRPIIDGEEAWSLLSVDIMKKTNLRSCLRLVINSTISREGHIKIPSEDDREVKEITDVEKALEEIEKYIRKKKSKDKNKIWLPEINTEHL